MLPWQTQQFFSSLTDNEFTIWQKIYIAQGAAVRAGNDSFEFLDELALDIHKTVGQKLIDRNERIEERIAGLGDRQAHAFMQKVYRKLRYQRFDMKNRVRVLTTILDIAVEGLLLDENSTQALEQNFPSLIAFWTDERTRALLSKREATPPCTNADIYDEMVDQALFIGKNGREPCDEEMMERDKKGAIKLCRT
ncbi:hypothetical protein L596_023284 [Steinernema carpocapsae]|uniref:Uncharacterized protein n=1 Tax=Steinernema carpocapsae TaxID=34508 RepID=A0A4U5MD66_STECR|nr:hypothetical protein L596_023284 [Steinernema carpocapsae]